MGATDTGDMTAQQTAVVAILSAQRHFAGTIEGLRDLMDELAPAATQLDEVWAPDALRTLITRTAGNPVEVEHHAQRFISEMSSSIRAMMEQSEDDVGPLEASTGISFRYVEPANRPESEDNLSLSFSELVDAVGDERLVLAFTGQALTGIPRTRVRRSVLLLSALDVMAVGALEVLIGNVIRSYMTAFPRAFGSDKKEFSLADLRVFSSMEEAADAAVQSKVEDIIRSGFDEWDRWLGAKDRLGASLDSLSSTSQVVIEAIQVRHLLVHTGGVISPQFLRKVPSYSGSVGDNISLSLTLLCKYIDAIESFGILVASQAMVRIDKESTETVHRWVFALAYDALRAGRWHLSLDLSRLAAQTSPSLMQKTMAKVNTWIAKASLEGRESVRAEITEWDTSALDPKFLLARCILLAEDDRAMDLVRSMFEDNTFSVVELAEWPLFKWIRDRQDFAELLGSGHHQHTARNREEEPE